MLAHVVALLWPQYSYTVLCPEACLAYKWLFQQSSTVYFLATLACPISFTTTGVSLCSCLWGYHRIFSVNVMPLGANARYSSCDSRGASDGLRLEIYETLSSESLSLCYARACMHHASVLFMPSLAHDRAIRPCPVILLIVILSHSH